MKTTWLVVTITALSLAPLGVQAQAPAMAMGEATAARKAQVEASARATVQNLFERLCPGRCEIIQLDAVMGEPSAAALVEPGFEDDAPHAYQGQVSTLRVDILLDSQLPGSFRQNIPRMLRYRLQELAPVVEVRTETLAFPEPQLEPTPPVLRDPPRAFAPMPSPPRVEPEPEPEPAPTPEPPARVPSEADLLSRAIPWIGGLAIALVLAVLILVMLRRLTQANKDTTAVRGAVSDADGSDAEARERARREIEDALRDKRVAANAALRRWIVESPDAVGRFVKLFGADSLRDLRSSEDAAPALARVARHLVAHPQPLSEGEESALLQEARARFAAAELEEGRSTEWEFLEGVSGAQLHRLLEDATVAERATVLAELPASARAAFVAGLSERDRAALLLEASAASRLAPADLRRLQARLRAAAEALRGQRGAGAELIGDLVRTVPANEQADLALRLLDERADAGEALLESVLLERSLAYLPSGVLADASAQLSIDTLVAFLRGTDPVTRNAVLGQLPSRGRGAVETELGLAGPVAKNRFYEARDALLTAAADVMHREGESIRSANAQALTARHPGVEHLEAAQ